MMDLRFSTSLQMVLSLAVAHERNAKCNSDELAAGLGANPALVRKLMVPLNRDGIILSSPGKHGGVCLNRTPQTITLLDVYKAAVDDKPLFATRPNVPDMCIVSRNIGSYFDALTQEAEGQLSSLLAGKTIAQSLEAIRQVDRSCVKAGHVRRFPQYHPDHAKTSKPTSA